jgi:hypothetical protein
MNKERLDRLLRVAVVGLAVYGFLLLGGWAGPASPSLRAFSACLALVVCSALTLHRAPSRRRLALAVGAAFLLPVAPPGIGQHALYCAGVGWVLSGAAPRVAPGLLLASMLAVLVSVEPRLERALGDLSSWIATLQLGPGEWPDYGPSASGVMLFLLCTCVLICSVGRNLRIAPILGVLAAAVLVICQHGLGELLHRNLGPYVSHAHPLPEFGGLWSLALGLALIVGITCAPSRCPTTSDYARQGGLLVTIAIGAGGLLSLLLLGGGRVGGTPVRSATFLNYGGLDWSTPSVTDIGAFSGGMFGLLPHYLERAGWKVSTLSREDVTSLAQLDSQVLVLINSPLEWDAGARDGVLRFMERGGSVLVLGDHTDVYGLMKGFNTLLKPLGVSYRFDSAKSDGASWFQDLSWGERRSGLRGDVRAVRVATGASLELESPAFPIVLGRYGFSDTGIRENVVGAYLGDYTYARGERLGDVVLVAGVRYGRGQTLVYGDTTPFQNSPLSETFLGHVLPVFEELAKRDAIQVSESTSVLLVLLSMATLAASCLAGQVRAGLAGALACAFVAISWDVEQSESSNMQKALEHAALVDLSHAPNIGDRGYEWNRIYPLEVAGLRTGIPVFRMPEWRPEQVRAARVVVLVAPQVPLSIADVEDLDECMRNGGTVVVLASGRDAAGVSPLLSSHGVSLALSSVGPVPARHLQDRLRPRLVDPSPIATSVQPEDHVLYRVGDSVFALARRVGNGKLVIIGDTRFASSTNVEGLWGAWPGNVRFLLDVWLEHCGGSMNGFERRFPDPPILPG